MKRLLVFLSAVFFVCSLGANDFCFDHFRAEKGLSSTAIWSIVQDKSSDIWFLGEGVIYRYNGFETFEYKSQSTVWTLVADEDNRVWAVSGEGILLYDRDGDAFTVWDDLSGRKQRQVTHSMVLSPATLAFYGNGDFFSYDPDTKHFDRPFDGKIAVAAAVKADSVVYLGAKDGGIFSWNNTKGTVERFLSLKAEPSSMILDTSGKLWIGTKGDGLYRYSEGNLVRLSKGRGNLSSNHILSLSTDIFGRLWAGTLVGLNIVEPNTLKSDKILRDNFDSRSLSHNTVRCICRDSQGGMWLGTYFGGMNYWHPARNRFKPLRPEPGSNSINDDITSCIVEDGNGLVWIGTNMGGVNCYDPSTQLFTHYLVSKGSEGVSESNDVKAIVVDDGGRKIWVGTYGAGLNQIDSKDGSIKHYNRWTSVYSLDKSIDGKLWVGSTSGLYLFDPADGGAERVGLGRVVFMFHSSDGRFWVCYADRTEVYSNDLLTDNVTPKSLAGMKHICDIFESSDGDIWLSTLKGIFRYKPSSDELTTIEGLGTDHVYGVEEDEHGKLWIASGSVLHRYDPKTGDITNFTSKGGLVTSMFQEYSHCRLSNGEMMFGGVGGINVFRPSEIAKEYYCPQPIIDAIYISGEEVKINDDSGVLTSNLRTTKSITLNHSQNYITFKFSAPDYSSVRLTRFKYRMEGFDKSWYEAGADRIATYSNLPKGRYCLRVKAVNQDGAESASSPGLSIRVLPQWYLSNFAISCWCILLLLSVYFTVHIVIRHRDIANALKLQNLEKEHQRELGRLKVLKFINSGAVSESKPGKKVVTEIESNDERFMLEAISIVENNLGNPDFNTEMLARKMNVSRTSLYLRISTITGSSALNLIRKIRYSRACELLEEGKLTVAEIGYKIGARSPAYFTAGFKKYVGCSPIEYVRKQLNANK